MSIHTVKCTTFGCDHKSNWFYQCVYGYHMFISLVLTVSVLLVCVKLMTFYCFYFALSLILMYRIHTLTPICDALLLFIYFYYLKEKKKSFIENREVPSMRCYLLSQYQNTRTIEHYVTWMRLLLTWRHSQ